MAGKRKAERDPHINVVEGILEPHFETGTEGIIWSVYADRRPQAVFEQWSHDRLYQLKDGDYLTIYAPNNKTVVFSERIEFDWAAGYKVEGRHGQQAALGLWIHGVQVGYPPDDWARFFFPHRWMADNKEDIHPLWATLIKRPAGHFRVPKALLGAL